MAGIRVEGVPQRVDGPSLVAAASGLMLLPTNASRYVRLHRLAALGMALPDHGAGAVSPSTIRSILKRDDVGGPRILMLEDPYSEVLVQSITFSGGPYLVSGGSGEHSVSDLENLIDAAFRDPWMPRELRALARQLVQGLLTVSDIVLKRAGLARGAEPAGSARTPVDVPGAARLKELADAAFISNEELDAHGRWLRVVVDTFALDPGHLNHPCQDDYTDDRLYEAPFLRTADGYRVVLPLDLAISIRFHLLRFVEQEAQLAEFGKRWRQAALRRFMRLLPSDTSLEELEHRESFSRYLISIDGKRDLHLVLATDPLVDWEAEIWGQYNTRPTLEQLADLMTPEARASYSSAEDMIHLVITDSPGRGAFWGVPNVEDSDPMLIARSDDLEVILHQEPDGLLGLLLFAQAVENRPGESMSFSILDEFSSYAQNDKSFYLSDDRPATFTAFQTGDGLSTILKFSKETDRHGVVVPVPGAPIIQVQRRYELDAPEIFITVPNTSYIGSAVELEHQTILITVDPGVEGFIGVEIDLLDCVAYWVRECAACAAVMSASDTEELVLLVSDPESWKRADVRSTTDSAVRARPTDRGLVLEFTETFAAQLQQPKNTAERELVAVLLTSLFGAVGDDLARMLDLIAPEGTKRMINVFSQDRSPDMLAENLPRPLTGHEQVDAQLLDGLGEWLRSPEGGDLSTGVFDEKDRVRVLNSAVSHLFKLLEDDIAVFDRNNLIDFLVSQNESLLHNARLSNTLLAARLACFGEQSHTVTELVKHRKGIAAAHRANRFLIEYTAAQPPAGARDITILDYYRILSIAKEIGERGTISDFLHYDLADFQVSILGSGRLGVSREQPVIAAMEKYAANSGTRSVRNALRGDAYESSSQFDGDAFIANSSQAMSAEFGFTLAELREVCGGLLDLATADRVTRIDRATSITKIAANRNMSQEAVSTVISAITLTPRSSFLSIGQDAWPWRFNRDMSYIRRPLVLQGNDLVFGFRGIYRLGVYWADNLLSGRLQGRAKSIEMQHFISRARGKVNDDFARSVAARCQKLGMDVRVSVKKIGKNVIADSAGNELGDVDILAVHPRTRSIIAIEAKDFEISRTPAEIANELQKLFLGKKNKKSTAELHSRRIDWLRKNLHEVVPALGHGNDGSGWQVVGAVVTSDPLLTPLLQASPFPVIPFDDLELDSLNLSSRGRTRRSNRG
ncbi:hypothetical protein [Microbacterium radiodurans]|uniref:NERD domain-containing protein n=1 Tax=Microbacterium radiodurans TaxID=661398 RepID=A0A5J5IT66_9MICO|nr:hypothetical protein [Microbacterium radiodurans]KAA9087221.1 hypothetical protein F6B42_09740 [Microbacterium radiodurans]